MKNPHMSLVALDPPGHPAPRRYRCHDCRDEGLLADLRARECPHVYPPCEHCGQAPECALDCPGIAAIFARPDVRVVGDLPEETRRAVQEHGQRSRSS